jgi:cytochrome c551/c552
MVRRSAMRIGFGIFVSLVVVFVLIQFIAVDKSNPPVTADILTPPEVKAILRRACYDCHSNETVWPWYSQVAPFSWLLAHDVHEGRAELNFSSWDQYNTREQIKKMKKSWEEIQEGEMPPWYYLSMHQDAALADADHQVLHAWALSTANTPNK